MKFESFITNKNRENSNDNQILSNFSPEQQKIIKEKQQILSAIAGFIGKDFNMPVYLNDPGAGWHWNFKDNHIKIDPMDILEKPMDYLRFVIAHEGGHRRVSRTEFIPKETLQTPGFLTMMNCIEDPRMNNFVAESYPLFREQMIFSYNLDLEEREKMLSQSKEKLGFIPKHELAGLEYINQWFREVNNQDFKIDERLPDDVRDVVEKTLPDAAHSWKIYTTKAEADGRESYNYKGKSITGEEAIYEFAKKSYEINLEKIWPLYKTLLESDQKDTEVSQMLEDLKKELQDQKEKFDKDKQNQENSSQEGQEGQDSGKLQELIKNLTEEEQQKLVDEMKKSIESENSDDGKGTPIQLDNLPESLKEKIKDMIENLSDDIKKDLENRAKEKLNQASKDFAEQLQSHMKTEEDHEKETQNTAESKDKDDTDSDTPEQQSIKKDAKEIPRMTDEELRSIKSDTEAIHRTTENLINNPDNKYEQTMMEVLPIINELEDDLREIFVQRRARGWQTGYQTGRKIDITRRIQEKAKGINVFESTAWKNREAPTEQDYAITLLVDLSGSMSNGNKIQETFKSVVVLSEVLNKLSLNVEILGFNDRIHVYQEYGQDINDDMRHNISDMLDEVEHGRAKGNPSYNDDGYAVMESSARLSRQDVKQKFLIVLSDGLPKESDKHSGLEYDLHKVIKHITEETDQKVIGLGIGNGTGHVAQYYPNSIANITTSQMAEKISDLLRDLIINSNQY